MYAEKLTKTLDSGRYDADLYDSLRGRKKCVDNSYNTAENRGLQRKLFAVSSMSKNAAGARGHPYGTPGAGQGAWGKESQLDRSCNCRKVAIEGVTACATAEALSFCDSRVIINGYLRTCCIRDSALLYNTTRESVGHRVGAVINHNG